MIGFNPYKKGFKKKWRHFIFREVVGSQAWINNLNFVDFWNSKKRIQQTVSSTRFKRSGEAVGTGVVLEK